MGTSYGKDHERIIRIMELITDNFSRCLHHPETISPIRHYSPLGIARPSDRSGNQRPAASASPSSYAFGACAVRLESNVHADSRWRCPRLPRRAIYAALAKKTNFSSP
jgi:hypothetical protein